MDLSNNPAKPSAADVVVDLSASSTTDRYPDEGLIDTSRDTGSPKQSSDLQTRENGDSSRVVITQSNWAKVKASLPSAPRDPAAARWAALRAVVLFLGNQRLGQLTPRERRLYSAIFFSLYLLFASLSIIFPSLKAHLNNSSKSSQALSTVGIAIGFVFINLLQIIWKHKELSWAKLEKKHAWSLCTGGLLMLGMGSYSSLVEDDGASSVLAPLAGGLYILIPIIFGILVLKEPVSVQKVLGILLAITAIVLLSVQFPGVGSSSSSGAIKFSNGMTVLYLCICFFGWGFQTVIMVMLGKGSDDHLIVQAISSVGSILGCCIAAFAIQRDFSTTHINYTWVFSICSGVCLAVGHYFYYKLARVNGQASILAPLCGLYVIFPILFGIAVLGDHVTYVQIIGLFLAVFAILLMSADFRALLTWIKSNKVYPLRKRIIAKPQIVMVREGSNCAEQALLSESTIVNQTPSLRGSSPTFVRKITSKPL